MPASAAVPISGSQVPGKALSPLDRRLSCTTMSLAVGNKRSLDDPAPLTVPLSFPSILRNPGIASRYAYLSDSTPQSVPKPIVPKKHKHLRRDDNEGKRWIRRKENGPSRQFESLPNLTLNQHASLGMFISFNQQRGIIFRHNHRYARPFLNRCPSISLETTNCQRLSYQREIPGLLIVAGFRSV